MRTLGRSARLALVCGIWLLTSGCFLNGVFSWVLVEPGEGGQTSVSLQASANVRVCADLSSASQTLVDCEYNINGVAVNSTASLVAEFGLLGFILDPLILQVPAAASGFSGTFSGTGASGNLSITVVPGTLPAAIGTTITPEPGTKLVIVDFPNPPPPLDFPAYGYTLNFQLPGDATPVRVKALFAARVESNGQTFFVPLLPCETSFANISAITLPASAGFQSVTVPLTGVLGCAGTVFNLSAAAQAVPTLGTWGVLLLSASAATYGAYRLRFRSPGKGRL